MRAGIFLLFGAERELTAAVASTVCLIHVPRRETGEFMNDCLILLVLNARPGVE